MERKLDISVKFESDRKSGVLGKVGVVGKDEIEEDVGRVVDDELIVVDDELIVVDDDDDELIVVDDDELIVVFDEFVVDVFIGAYSVKSRSNVFSSMI